MIELFIIFTTWKIHFSKFTFIQNAASTNDHHYPATSDPPQSRTESTWEPATDSAPMLSRIIYLHLLVRSRHVALVFPSWRNEQLCTRASRMSDRVIADNGPANLSRACNRSLDVGSINVPSQSLWSRDILSGAFGNFGPFSRKRDEQCGRSSRSI